MLCPKSHSKSTVRARVCSDSKNRGEKEEEAAVGLRAQSSSREGRGAGNWVPHGSGALTEARQHTHVLSWLPGKGCPRCPGIMRSNKDDPSSHLLWGLSWGSSAVTHRHMVIDTDTGEPAGRSRGGVLGPDTLLGAPCSQSSSAHSSPPPCLLLGVGSQVEGSVKPAWSTPNRRGPGLV